MSPEQIKAGRLAVPLTQVELADLAGVSPQAVRNWEAGRRTPRPAQVRTIEAIFARRPLPARCTCVCHTRTTTRSGVRVWTDEETNALRQLIGEGKDPDQVVDALAELTGHRRTRPAIDDRARRLGLTFMRGLSVHRVSFLLGVRHHRVEHWIARKILPARRHVSIAQGAASRWWRIESADLEAFVQAYAGEAFSPATVRDRALRTEAEIAAALRGRRAI